METTLVISNRRNSIQETVYSRVEEGKGHPDSLKTYVVPIMDRGIMERDGIPRVQMQWSAIWSWDHWEGAHKMELEPGRRQSCSRPFAGGRVRKGEVPWPLLSSSSVSDSHWPNLPRSHLGKGAGRCSEREI